MNIRDVARVRCRGTALRQAVVGAVCALFAAAACEAADFVTLAGKSNLVANAGFEESTSSGLRPLRWSIHEPGSNTLGWSWSFVNSPGEAHRGSRCLKFAGVYSRGNWADRLYAISDAFSIDAASRYVFRVWYRTAGASDGAVIIRIRYLDASGAEIYSDQTGVEAAEGSWRPADLFLHPPDGTARARAVRAAVQVYLDHCPGSLWVDDIGVFKLDAAEIPAVYPFGKFSPPSLSTNGAQPAFSPGAVAVRQAPDGAWWISKHTGAPFYLNTIIAGEPTENSALTNYLWTVRGMTPTQYADESAVRMRRDLQFNAGYKSSAGAATEFYISWLNFSTETSLPGTNWILRSAEDTLFGSAGHWFPDPFSPAWQNNAQAQADTISSAFVERADAVGYWTDNEWAYGPMFEHFWSDNCRTALVAWLQGKLSVPAGFAHPRPYSGIAALNAAWSSAYHTYAYTSFDAIYGSDKPRIRAFNDPTSSDLLLFERVVFKTYVDTVVSSIRRREDKLIADLARAGRTGYHHLIMSCRIAFDGPGYGAEALRRNMDIFGAFDVIAVNAYPVYRNSADHYPRSYLDALKRTFHDASGRPLLISEFGVAARDAVIKVARWHDRTVESQAERGTAYRNLSAMLANLPWVVGQSWYKWSNGYGTPEGNDPRNCGIVNDGDVYYPDLAGAVVDTNLRINGVRRDGGFTLDDVDWRSLSLPVYDSAPPQIRIVQPGSAGTTGTVSTVISWEASDPDSPARVTLYASTNAATAANGAPIAGGLLAGRDTQFVWNVQGYPPGSYWVVASIEDDSGPPRWAQSECPIAVPDDAPAPRIPSTPRILRTVE